MGNVQLVMTIQCCNDSINLGSVRFDKFSDSIGVLVCSWNGKTAARMKVSLNVNEQQRHSEACWFL